MPNPNANIEKYMKYNFIIEIDGFDVALFTKGKLPSVEFSVAEFHRAGSMFPEKHPSKASYEDLDYEKGVFDSGVDKAAYDWVTQIIDVNTHTRQPLSVIKRPVHLVQYDPTGAETRRWILHNAFAKKYDAGELEGAAEDHNIEILTICYEYYTMG